MLKLMAFDGIYVNLGKLKYDCKNILAPMCTGNCSILGNVHRLDSALDIDEASIWLFWRPPLRRLATLWFVGGLFTLTMYKHRATFLGCLHLYKQLALGSWIT